MITSGFSVIHSNHLEFLRDIAIEWIRKYPLNPLENEHFLVQSHGMGQWLKMALAENDGCGICSALTVQLPGHFLWQIYRTVLGDNQISKSSPYAQEQLVWRLLKLLPDLLSISSFLPLKRFLETETQVNNKQNFRKTYQLACHLASIFDQYQVYRADWLESWSSGQDMLINAKGEKTPLPKDQQWQAELWRKIRQDVPEDQREKSRADLHQRFLARVKKLDQQIDRERYIDRDRDREIERDRERILPRRVIVFGICSLPCTVIEALHAISNYCQVLLFVQNPCREYWADIIEDRNINIVGTNIIETKKVNPLLAAWGKQGRDYIGMLDKLEQSLHQFGQTQLFMDIVPKNVPQDEIQQQGVPQDEIQQQGVSQDEIQNTLQQSKIQNKNGSLLQQVQQAILDLKPLPVAGEKKNTISPDDDSITFQLCHTQQREVEVLHDQLLSFFDSMPELTPRDIIVMTPDINAYAPHITAVFGNLTTRYIPFTIADKPEQESMQMLLGLEKLLFMPDSRMTVGDVMEFLQIPAFRNRFEIGESDLPKLNQWIQGAKIRWGLTPEHREELVYKGVFIDGDDKNKRWEQNTWQFGLRRMMLGYAVGAGEPWQDIEPYDEIGGLEATLAGKLFSIIEKLEKHWRRLAQPAIPAVWCRKINDLLKDFFIPTDSRDRIWLNHMDDLLEKWLQSCNDADLKDKLILTVVRDYILKEMNESTTSHRFLAGMVNFCTLMPMRAIPFKVVCLLGMNDGAYPRSKPPLDFDLMAMNGFYRSGDRSKREDDHYLFLEALLSAREKLYISYIGRSVRDNTQKMPSVLVGQLRDYLAAGWTDD